jgi:hypothetical protein
MLEVAKAGVNSKAAQTVDSRRARAYSLLGFPGHLVEDSPVRTLWLCGVPLLAVLGLAVPGLPAADDKDEKKDEKLVTNPYYKQWASFKVGTTARQRDKVYLLDDSPESKRYPDGLLIKVITYKLLEVTPEQVALEAQTVDHEPGELIYHAPFKVVYPAKVPLAEAQTPKDQFVTHKEGEEKNIKLADGKVVNSTWVETSYEHDGIVYYQKIWLSDEVPGGILKDKKIQKKGDKVIQHSSITLIDFKTP